MAPRKLQMTPADYVVIAVSPALIMMLVGSLAFFLIELAYDGQYKGRLNWIMFWFVMATVLIARISMEEGAERGSLYGLALACAVALAMFRLVDQPLLACALMALVWWSAHKLTWDCTLIDDTQDASGQGLLQITGLESGEPETDQPRAARPPAGQAADELQQPGPARRSSLTGWIERVFGDPAANRRRPHAPGVWVVYFSLAALPLFGLGQALIPAGDEVRRRYAFWLLFWYVASGLGLLLTTSFLGLRRYLRQRKLEMPRAMTGAWLGVGAALIVVLLLAGTLLPRPSAEYSMADSVQGMLGSPVRRASDHALLKDSPGEGPAKSQAPPAADSPPPDDSSTQSSATGSDKSESSSPNHGDPSAKQPPGGGSAGRAKSGAEPASSQKQPGSRQSDSGQSPPGSENRQDSGQEGSQAQGQDRRSEQGKRSEQGQTMPPGSPTQPPGQTSKTGQPPNQQQPNRSQANQQPSDQQRSNAEQQDQQAAGQPGQKPEQPSDQQPSDQQPSDRQPSDQQPANKQSSDRQPPDRQQSDQRPTEQRTSQQHEQSSAQANRAAPPAARRNPSQPPRSSWQMPDLRNWLPGAWLRWLVYLALAVAALYAAIKYRQQALDFLKQMWQELIAIWQSLFGGKRTSAKEEQPAVKAEVPRPFAAFRNPFFDGAANHSSVNELVCYTFEALEAWAWERDTPREPDATPLEFARNLAAGWPGMSTDVRTLAELYVQVNYARARLGTNCLQPLRSVWQQMQAASPPHASMAAP